MAALSHSTASVLGQMSDTPCARRPPANRLLKAACDGLMLPAMSSARLGDGHACLLDHHSHGEAGGEGAAAAAAVPVAYTVAEKQFLLQLAKATLREAVTTGRLPILEESAVPTRLTEMKGCFVTLTRRGRLRGCIGHLLPQQPLYRAVMENARDAALRDHRFEPLEERELSEIEIEISVLTKPQSLAFTSPEELLQQLRPHRHGVVLNLGCRSSTFLPQVWEQVPDKVEFLDRLAVKAGGEVSDWREPGTRVLVYEVEAFRESDFPADTAGAATNQER